MNVPAPTAQAAPLLSKRDPNASALIVLDRTSIAVRAGTTFAGHLFEVDTLIAQPAGGYEVGADYAVNVIGGIPQAVKIVSIPTDPAILGGFHFAPGGNAQARAGGDSEPAINPCSIWDVLFRPSCPDPRGMVLVESASGRFWCDVYLLAKDHLKHGTSAFGVTIADGDAAPQNLAGGYFSKLDYATAVAVLKHHGKGPLSVDEFFAAAFGVTEKSAIARDPKKIGLDAARTSRFGLMQAAGNLWIWGHDGDPDEPRPSVFGGSWVVGSYAGSRSANLALWPEYSRVNLGARGRSDHLQLG